MSENPYDDLRGKPSEGPSPSISDAPTPDMRPLNPYDALVGKSPEPPAAPRQRAFNEPFGELKPAEYSPRERLGNWAQDALIAGGMQPYSAGHIGRGVRDAASLIPPVGAAIAGADTAYYANKGDQGMAAVSALGIAPGATTARRAWQGMPVRTLAPEEAQLGRDADQVYSAWRNSPVRYDPKMMDDVTGDIARKLIQRGVNPSLKQDALNVGQSLKTASFPPRGLTNSDFDILRRQLGGGRDRSEIAAGEEAKTILEDYMKNPPQQFIRSGTPAEIASDRKLLERGRGDVAAKYRSELISGKADTAEIKEERGKDYIDTFRGRMEALNTTKAGQKELRGFNEEERNRVRNEVAGSLMERASSGVGKAIDKSATAIAGLGGAYGGAVPAATVGGGLFGSGFGIDPYTGAAIAGGLWTGSKMLGKGLQGHSTDLAKRSADELSAAMRMRSPLAQEPGSPYGVVTDPGARANDLRKYLMYPWLRQEGQDYVNQENVPFENR